MQLPRVLQATVPHHIWVTERPVWFSGVRLRSRTTIVRLAGDELWVHSPGPPTDDFCRELDGLGKVRWIVAPNMFHHLGIPQMAARYPEATVVGPESAQARNSELKVELGAHDPEYLDATPDLQSIQIRGVPFLDETVFFHRPTSSLIAADLLMSACARDHFTWRYAAKIWGRYEKVGTPPDVRMKTRPSPEVAASMSALVSLPIDRILVAHADPITESPIEQLTEAWKFALPRG